MLSCSVGTVRGRKTSLTVEGVYCVGSNPEVASTTAHSKPGGSTKGITGSDSRAVSIKSCQMGPAPREPGTCSIGSLSLLPTQTPVHSWGGNPIVHESPKSVVVPVLAAL